MRLNLGTWDRIKTKGKSLLRWSVRDTRGSLILDCLLGLWKPSLINLMYDAVKEDMGICSQYQSESWLEIILGTQKAFTFTTGDLVNPKSPISPGQESFNFPPYVLGLSAPVPHSSCPRGSFQTTPDPQSSKSTLFQMCSIPTFKPHTPLSAT